MTVQPPEHRPGLTELPGAIVTGVIDGLSGKPALLAIVILNIAMIGSLVFAALEVSKARTEIINSLIERCLPDKR